MARPESSPAVDDDAAGARHRRVVTLVLVALLALPVVVALGALRTPRWYPIGDLAQTEMRVAEVGTADTPLVGLAGRIGSLDDPGHHPGPAGFYALAPLYRLLGAGPFALQVSTGALSVLALGLSVWLAHRRGGRLFAVGTAAALAVLARSLGPRVVTEPWNPYLPVLWWVVVLLAVWSVWCDDDALLPLAAAGACLAAQTHVPYAGLVAVLGGATVLRLAWREVRARRARAGTAPPAPAPSRRWVAVAAALGVAAWIPPVVDELTEEPGNLTVLARYFLTSDGEPVGLGSGLSLWLSRLDPWTLVTGSLDGPVTGNRAVGAAFVVVWAVAAAVAWRRRDTAMVRLHEVTGLAALAGLASMSRIYGALHYYLVLWAWSTTTVAVVAVVATLARAAASRAPERQGAGGPWARVSVGLPVAVLLVATAVATGQASGATQSSAVHSEALGEVVGPTVAALRSGDVHGGGEGPYEVRADDPYVIGTQAYGLFHELRREGIDARLPARLASTAGGHIVPDDEAVPVVVVAVGPRIDAWRQRSAALEVAAADPRSPAERRRQRALIDRVEAELLALGRADQAAQVEQNLLVLAVDGDLPRQLGEDLEEVVDIGAPLAVFVLPAGA